MIQFMLTLVSVLAGLALIFAVCAFVVLCEVLTAKEKDAQS